MAATVAVAAVAGLLVALAVQLLLVVPRRSRVRAAIESHTRAFDPTSEYENKQPVARFLARNDAALASTRPGRALAQKLTYSAPTVGPAAFVYGTLGLSLGLAVLAAIASLSGAVIGLAVFFGLAVPYLAVSLVAARRLGSFDDQLPDALEEISAMLKGGQGLQQALQAVARDSAPPFSTELTRALREVELGLSVQEALENMAERVNSRDLRFVVVAIAIQGQIGGSLAGLFEQISQTVRARRQFARRVRALTATGRASATVLGALPFFVLVLLAIIGHGYLSPLFNTRAGAILDVIAVVLLVSGFLSLRKIVSFRL